MFCLQLLAAATALARAAHAAGYAPPAPQPGAGAQSDVEAPSYVPSYLRYTKTAYSHSGGYGGGTKTYGEGTKTYGGGTKTYGGGTKTVYSGTKSGYGNSYSESRTWHSGSGEAPSLNEFYSNANSPYRAMCDPECQNSGICVETNTCLCPATHSGRYCEFEKKPCLTHPPLPLNSRRKCSSEMCTVQCMEGHKFPDGTSVANLRCVQGQWQPTRADLAAVPDCQPECDPPCLNGGACLSRDFCSCPLEYKGPQCQYAASACDIRRAAFNGGYECASQGAEELRCALSCPAGASFSAPPASHYTCRYSTGRFDPHPLPHCVYPDVVVITPTNYYNRSFYSVSESGNEHTSHQVFSSVHRAHGAQGVHDEHVDNIEHVVRVMSNEEPSGGTCLTWAGAHYKTFDGAIYTFESSCQHVLVRERAEHRYTVALRAGRCARRAYCPLEITVYLEDKPYVLTTEEDGSVVFRSGRRLLPLPAALPGLRAAMPGAHVLLTLDQAGLSLKWDTNNVVEIEGSVLLWNNTEGLCGRLDGRSDNDRASAAGAPLPSAAALAASWTLHKIGDTCETRPTETATCATETADDVAKATQFCNDMISMSKFRKCSKVMDVLQFLEACKWDYCACASTSSSEECACKAISVYASECLRHGVAEMKAWRAPDLCPMKCPEGKLYKSCGSEVQPSCAAPEPVGVEMARGANGTTCVEGCFCPDGLLLEGGRCVARDDCPCRLRNKSFPPGHVLPKDCNTCTCVGGTWQCSGAACGARCRAVGDPHYATFDGTRYDFMGHCSYTMLRAPDTLVTVHNVACSGAITEAMNLAPYKGPGRPSCTKSVSVQHADATVLLQRGGRIDVNGSPVTALPLTVQQVRVRVVSSLFVIAPLITNEDYTHMYVSVQLPNKVDVWWDGDTRVFIDVPPEFRGETKGLCGTFNMNQADDYLTPENDVEQSVVAFGNKWKTREACSDEEPPATQHPCRDNVQNKEPAERYCALLKSKLFQECHWYVDVEAYYESCLYDMCACAGDISHCLCPILGDYAMSCAAAGIKVQWRYNVKECELQCDGGQEYSVCADSCARTCADRALPACQPRCVEGCACPPGQLLDESNVCVPVALCPCYHQGLRLPSGHREVRAGRRELELCTCVGAKWECVPAQAGDAQAHPPAADLRANCSAAAGMEFTACMRAEPLTCKNMHNAREAVDVGAGAAGGECRAGCACAAGLVLDAGAARCMRPEHCPCHHAGVSYRDGDTVRDRCNTCTCKSGNWSCTEEVCPGECAAWGDSHIVTFDGNMYDFEGVCTYLLAKGSLDQNDGFDIQIQNAACGTTGATCSKSVTLRVGAEAAVLTRGAPLPAASALRRIRLREAGALVFLDVPSLGVSLRWDRELRVYVTVDTMWRGRIKGLCGNYNGDMRDDFQTPSSGALSEDSPLIFAESWKMKPTCPKVQPVTEHCAERAERAAWAEATCSALKREPFAACHAHVPLQPYLERCARDACACDAGGDCICACAALAHYAHACAHYDVHINWRNNQLCPMQCDEECSKYDSCVSPCPVETCDNTLYYSEIKTTCEKDNCVEGCAPRTACAVGSVRVNGSSAECVARVRCAACLAPGGARVPEGAVLSEDECHTCRCSRSHIVCTGEPCASTTPADEMWSSERPLDEPLKCVDGWTPWISTATPTTDEAGNHVELEPVPSFSQMVIGGPMCAPEMMKDIECRTVEAHARAKDTGLDVECSLERGLVCREPRAGAARCPDFEIRLLCQCSEKNVCDNMTEGIEAHEWDCIKFVECSAGERVEKSCGPGTLFNPRSKVCDWPAAVLLLRPDCAPDTTLAPHTSPFTTGASHSTWSSTRRSTTAAPESSTPTATEGTTHTAPTTARCPSGQVYLNCAYACDKLCDHFKKKLHSKGRCITEKCVDACVEPSVANIKCSYASYWRDEKTCVPKKDCTCFSEGKIIKPGGVEEQGCLKCQCLDNEFHCDSSDCVSIFEQPRGTTHESIVTPYIIHTPSATISATTPISTSTSTWTTTPKPASTSPSPGAPSAATAPPLLVTPASPPPTIIAVSTATPPPDCSPTNYTYLMWGTGLPKSAFTASSQLSEMFAPYHAELDGTASDSAGSWSPESGDAQPHLQVALRERLPLHGVVVQGSPLYDQFVTSYLLRYSDDAVLFHDVLDPATQQPRVFRGPVDARTPLTQIIYPPIEAKYVRLYPLTWHGEVSVRMELIGCRQPDVHSTTEPLNTDQSTTEQPTTEKSTTDEFTSEKVTSTTAYEYEATSREPLVCAEPLGVGARLPLDLVSVSSNERYKEFLALDHTRGWRPLYSTPGEWIMFNLTSARNITGVITKGGQRGWVSALAVQHARDPAAFSRVIDQRGDQRIYPANFDSDSEAVIEFHPPLHAQYLKVLPIKWKNNIEIRIEPIGCYIPYPEREEPSTESPSPSPSPAGACVHCPGAAAAGDCDCPPPLHYDGENCVPRQQCPCIVGFMTYPVGSVFRGEECVECVCKLGGVAACAPLRTCACDPQANPNSVAKLDKSSCECVCEECTNGTLACSSGSCLPAARWCDGLQDCPEDELNCRPDAAPTTLRSLNMVTLAATPPTPSTTTTTTTVAPTTCPVVECPPGYKVYYASSRPRSTWYLSDLPPPRPRYSYQGYHKGGYTKRGYSKGGFSKGGFSKGGFINPLGAAAQSFTLEKPSGASAAAAAPAPAPACQQFKCMPPVPPFHRPGVTPEPIVCSVATCPKGYTLKLETLRTGFTKCPQYECEPPAERPAWCNVTGRTFNTFDGAEYKYDVCFHILARDNRLDSWTVLVRKKCSDEGCWNELLVHQDDELIVVMPSLMIEYNNYQYTVEQTSKICFQRNSFDVARLGDGVLVRSRRYNFTVLYNKDGDVKIGVLASLHLGHVDGLCGAYDGAVATDRRLPDGRAAATLEQFGRAWQRPGMPSDACAPHVTNERKQKRVWELCDVITKEPWSECGSVVSLHKWRSICLEKVCECSARSGRSEEQCRCEVLQQLAAECLAAAPAPAPDLSAWRLLADCPASCPAPLVHYDCYRRSCEPACGAASGARCEPSVGACFPGCFCPAGTLRDHDRCLLPHECLDCTCTGAGSPATYETFEGDELPPLGNCTYLVSRDTNRTGYHKYQVYTTNGPCGSKSSLVCTKAVHVVFGEHVLQVTRALHDEEMIATLDGRAVVQLPAVDAWGALRREGRDLLLTLAELHVEVQVSPPRLQATVRAASAVHGGRTEGLCGVCAGAAAGLLAADHNITTDIEKFSKSWQASENAVAALGGEASAQCDAPPPAPAPPPCLEADNSTCLALLDPQRFGKCHPLVEPEMFVEACVSEVCAGGNACGALERYAVACRAQRVCLAWREPLCPLQCEAPLVFHACLECERSCADPRDPPPCRETPREGCFCPLGKVRVNNTCIEPSKCFPCDAERAHYAGDEWQEDACTSCSCRLVEGEARTSCTTRACAAPPCAAPLRLRTVPPAPGDCCPTYLCVEEPKTIVCPEPKRLECSYGQELKQRSSPEGCADLVCECVPAAQCPPLGVGAPAPGARRELDVAGCCPRARDVCDAALCPAPPTCAPLLLRSVNISTQCCPEHSCELPKGKCLVKLEWEGLPSGGERAREKPEEVLKDSEERWQDGPCRSCACAAGAAACQVQACPAPPRDPERELRAVHDPYTCCPRYEHVACRDKLAVYQVNESWVSSENACVKYTCTEVEEGRLEKVTTVQSCDTQCRPGWDYVQSNVSGECCGACVPVACVVEGVLRDVGSAWSSRDHCLHYTCVQVNGTVQVEGTNETCPEVSEAVRKQFVLDEDKIPGKCCPALERLACRDGNNIYQEGQSWASSPCMNKTCMREQGELSVSTSVQRCEETCVRGHELQAPRAGRCCGECRPAQCAVGERLHEPGSHWSSADNCTSYSCERTGDVLAVVSARVLCPDVSGCHPRHLRNDSCCLRCDQPPESHSTCVPVAIPLNETVGLVRVTVRGETCVNEQPVPGLRECRGACHSGAFYNTQRGVHEVSCECCAPAAFGAVEARVQCAGGARAHRVASPTRCACAPCADAAPPVPSLTHEHTGRAEGSSRSTAADDDVIPQIFHRFGEFND